MMCNECCKQFKGWCKSFTPTEALLALLEAFLFVVFFVFLLFLILHFIACSKALDQILFTNMTTEKYGPDKVTNGSESTETTVPSDETLSTETTVPTNATISHVTVPPGVECTWTPSAKTPAVTRYYEGDHRKDSTITKFTKPAQTTIETPIVDVDDLASSDHTDGEGANDNFKHDVLALVKMRPPREVTFGCILTVITEYWTLTAASCIESIEEVDSLDSFVMMEAYGEVKQGRTHVVADVQIHPQYQGANRSHDLAALRSEDLLHGLTSILLPTMIDYFLITIGERFTLLGFGGFRTIDAAPSGRGLREVFAYVLPAQQCAGGGAGEVWALRHLQPGVPAAHAACGGAAPLCCGVLYARGKPCNYCAGTPLLRADTLLGLMSDAHQCGVACEPALYVNVAAARDWIDHVLDVQ